jgi:hypothetical protein
MPVSSSRKERILLYFPPVVLRSRGNIHSHSLSKVVCKGEASYYGQGHRLGIKRAS